MNSLPLSVCRAHRANGSQERISSSAWKTHFCALLSTARTSVHWVRRSVSTRVKACSPPVMPPSWPTKSAPTSPGRASCHSVKVRIGISFIRRVVGLVWERPRTRRARFSVRSSRSMVAALMSVSFWRVSGSKVSSPNLSSRGTCVRRTATSRLPHRQPNRYQTFLSAATTCSS